MINKILIRKSDRKTLHKDRRSLGMSGENLQEVLLFCLDEKIEGTGIVEVELPNGEKGMIEVERTEEGYELPVKSSLLTQTGFVKFQLRILHDNEEIFKSEIIALEVKDSINATATIPEEYPSWVDTLTNLKKDLEKAESERVSNENERISAEKTRQENFTEMQKTVENATSNIKDLKEDYNENAKQKTEEFNKNFEEKQKAINDNAEAKTTAFGENAEAQTKTFNTNSDDKLAEYNRNHTAKMKEFDDNYDTKTKTFDDNAAAKLEAYNKNDEAKISTYNANDKAKTDAYNNNASHKEETFNTNAADKQNEFDENASDKLAEYNQNAKELINKVEQVQAENETLKAENKLLKEQIPSASASGNSIHVEDSGTLDFEWKINGNQYQATREGYNLLNNTLQSQTINGLKVTVNKDKSVTVVGTATANTNIAFDVHNKTIEAGTYTLKDCRTFIESTENQGWWDNGGTKTFTNTATLSNYGFFMFYSSGTVVNETLYPMLIKGSELKPYEQYGAMPSPDFPSEIKTVKDSVEIKVVNNDNTKSQSVIMPVQQEMLEGDYVADVEHHEWEKIIIDTSKLIVDNTTEEKKKRYRYGYDKNIKKSDATHNVAYSNMFKLLWDGQTFFNVKGFTIANNNIYIYDEGESLTEFKSKITDKQLVFYAQLETSINLELTPEQKAVRDTKLYTYKNVTNIDLSDELASIDVNYKKDPTTEHDELQNQIDEIKQLISTTETSALLLDNLQKDVESEVE